MRVQRASGYLFQKWQEESPAFGSGKAANGFWILGVVVPGGRKIESRRAYFIKSNEVGLQSDRVRITGISGQRRLLSLV
jgi:hypothetical protein